MSAKIKWTGEMDALLGKVIDEIIAERFGISRTSVIKRRRELGINPFGKNGHDVDWTPELDAVVLEPISARAASARLGISHSAVHARRQELEVAPVTQPPKCVHALEWTHEQDNLLGKMPDVLLAERLGVTPMAVFRRRKKLKIACHRDTHPRSDGITDSKN